jgi:hypothetical protein
MEAVHSVLSNVQLVSNTPIAAEAKAEAVAAFSNRLSEVLAYGGTSLSQICRQKSWRLTPYVTPTRALTDRNCLTLRIVGLT